MTARSTEVMHAMNSRTLAVGTFVLSTAIGTAAPAFGQCEPRWVPDTSLGGVDGVFPASVGTSVVHDPDGSGPLEPVLYVTGRFVQAGGSGIDTVATWDGVSWKPVHTSPATYGRRAWAFVSTRVHQLLAIGDFELDGSSDRTPLGIQVGDHWEPFDPQLRGRVWSVQHATDGNLYALGLFDASDGTFSATIKRLDRAGSVSVPCTSDGTIDWIAPSPGGGLIAYGTFTRIDNVRALNIAHWNGTSWTPLETTGEEIGPLQVRLIASMPDGSLVLGGRFIQLGMTDAYRVAIWDGRSFTSLGDISCRDIRAMSAARDGTVYIAGDEIRTGQQMGKVARWDGSRWNIIATNVEEIDVSTLGALDESSVFLGGAYREIDGTIARGAALWANRRWNSMGGDDRYRAFGVHSVDGFGVISQGQLYLADGSYSYVMARWTDSGWQLMDVPLPASWGQQFASNSDGDLLALNAIYTQRDGDGCVIRWDGSQWVALGTGLKGVPSDFKVLNDDRIIVTGNLTLDSTPCHVALWNGSSWNCIGAFVEGFVSTVTQMPDGTLVIGGSMQLNDTLNPTPLAAWIHERWTDISEQRIFGHTQALEILPRGSLIAAGQFYDPSDTLADINVFEWDGTSIQDFGSGFDFGADGVREMLIDTDGMPVIACSAGFATFDDLFNDKIVRWNGQSWERLGDYHSTTDAYYRSSVVSGIALHTNGDILVSGTNIRGVPSLGIRSSLCYSQSPAPRMAQSPIDLTINAGEHIVLSAAVLMNLDQVSFQWYRNGVAINSGPGGASESGGTVRGARGTIAGRTDSSLYTLTITNATPGDAGEYTISFTNPCGTAVSPAATVTVRCIGDINQDGGIDGNDLESFFTSWEAAAPDADVDLDGIVDSTDVSAFFDRWSNGRC